MSVIPLWAWYAFGVCFCLIILFLLLDYLVIRRNALGNTCCVSAKKSRNTGSGTGQSVNISAQTNEAHNFFHKRSTNMILNV